MTKQELLELLVTLLHNSMSNGYEYDFSNIIYKEHLTLIDKSGHHFTVTIKEDK